MKDRDGNPMKKKKLIHSRWNEVGLRHRSSKRDLIPVTTGFTIAWFRILIYQGATHADQKTHYWTKGRHGVYYPIVQNAMTRNTFEFLQRFTHFENKIKSKPSANRSYDPLWKIRAFMGKIMCAQIMSWTAGDAFTVDESMIMYMGKAISFLSSSQHTIREYHLS